MWKPVLNYNFQKQLDDTIDWSSFYSFVRRDANFAGVFSNGNNSYLAIRDHLGTVPIYYRKISGSEDVEWSFSYSNLVKPDDEISPLHIKNFLGIASPKIVDLIPEIKLVPPGTVLSIKNGLANKVFQYDIPKIKLDLSWLEMKEYLSKLLDTAVERTIKTDQVGLYLSGGMDSGLIGSILRKKGISIKSYTALPWGKDGTEFKYAKINTDLIKPTQSFYVDVTPDGYDELFRIIPEMYNTFHGTATAVNIASLWKNTEISTEKQVYFAQNTDTLTTSVPAQINALFMSSVPSIIRNKLVDMPRRTLIENYLHHCTRGAFHNHPYTKLITLNTKIQKLALAGMYIGHTPSDSEVINAPSIKINQLCSNPYYDMDLIEFYLNIPWQYKIAFNRNQKTILSVEKKLFRTVASEVLPSSLVNRKKGFVLPKDRSEAAVRYFKKLPNEMNGVFAKSHYEKISLHLLKKHLDLVR